MTPAQAARQLLEANIVQLGKKVFTDKKPLSTSEIALLQSIAGNGDANGWASNKVQLANALNVTRQTIHAWLKIDGNPGAAANGKYNVPKWREWRKARGLEDDDTTPDKAALQARNLILQNEKLEFQIGVLRKAYIPVADVERWGGELGADVCKVLDQIPRIAPQLEGLSAVELEKRLQEIVDEAKGCFQLLGKRIEQAKEAVVAEILEDHIANA